MALPSLFTLPLAACGDDDDEDAAGQTQCEAGLSAGDCPQIETCCNNTQCWYNATKGGQVTKFDCAGTNCETAAQDAVSFCMN